MAASTVSTSFLHSRAWRTRQWNGCANRRRELISLRVRRRTLEDVDGAHRVRQSAAGRRTAPQAGSRRRGRDGSARRRLGDDHRGKPQRRGRCNARRVRVPVGRGPRLGGGPSRSSGEISARWGACGTVSLAHGTTPPGSPAKSSPPPAPRRRSVRRGGPTGVGDAARRRPARPAGVGCGGAARARRGVRERGDALWRTLGRPQAGVRRPRRPRLGAGPPGPGRAGRGLAVTAGGLVLCFVAARAGPQLFSAAAAGVMPRFGAVALDPPVVLAGLVLAPLVGIACGGASVAGAARGDRAALRGGAAAAGSRAAGRLRADLVAGQIALSIVLLIGAGLRRADRRRGRPLPARGRRIGSSSAPSNGSSTKWAASGRGRRCQRG